ncbi:transmembrane protease serine 3 [Aphelenchoides avenae]|nr:transmembrane protease serine 3 [Aphelenchus avenae]
MKCFLTFSVLTLFVTWTVAYDAHECGRSYGYPEKIVGGNVSAEGQWPWAAALTAPGCTGSIISPRHILTAGHCAGQRAKDREIYIGSVNTDKSPVKASVLKVTPHPEFVLNCTDVCYEVKNDIAILELAEPLNFTKTIRPICLPLNFKEDMGEDAYTAGWGMHDGKGA